VVAALSYLQELFRWRVALRNLLWRFHLSWKLRFCTCRISLPKRVKTIRSIRIWYVCIRTQVYRWRRRRPGQPFGACPIWSIGRLGVALHVDENRERLRRIW